MPGIPPAWGRALLLVLVLTTLLRTGAALTVPLLDDEAHYWVWSRHLMWGYPDHPPMIAGLVALGVRTAGDTVTGIRLLPLLLGTASTAVIAALGARLYGPAAGLRAAVLFQAVPAFAAAGIIAAPDAPFGFFWLLGMLAGWTAVTTGAPWAWIVAGLSAGLALQSKLAGSALALAFVGFIVSDRRQRRWLRTPGPYLAGLAGLAVIAPLLWWNAAHQWATVRRAFQQDPWVAPVSPAANLSTLVATQFVYYAPLLFPLLVAAVIACIRQAGRDERARFLAWCSAPTLCAVLLAGTRALAKPHYTGPALLAGVVALAALWTQWRLRGGLRLALVTSAALTAAAVVLASVPNPLAAAFHQEVRAWPRVAEEIERVLPSLGAPGEVFVLAETYQAGSQIAYALRGRVPVVVPFRGFDLWEPPQAWLRRNGLLMDHLGGRALEDLAPRFERLEAPYVVPVGPDRAIRLFPGIRFRGL